MPEKDLPRRRHSPWLSFLSQQLSHCPEKLLGSPQPVSPGQVRMLVPMEGKGEGGGAQDLRPLSSALTGVKPFAPFRSSDTGPSSPLAVSVHRVKMMLGLSLGLSSEIFVKLGQVSSGALSSHPSAASGRGMRRAQCSRCG